jgi:hypothetical protein
MYPAKTIKHPNVKVISPSFPGHDGSDAQPFRSVANWPKDDVEPILHAENVDSFIVEGITSYGTAHAMHGGGVVLFSQKMLDHGIKCPLFT